MMNKYGLTGLALAASLAFAGMTQAAVIYNNGGPANDSGNDATQWAQAEDFTFTADVTVTGAGVYVGGFDGLSNWDGAVNYWIFGDNGGPDNILVSGAGQNISATDTGNPWLEGNTYLIEFDLESDFAAAADTTYWLAIHLSDDFDRDDIYWATTTANGTSAGQESLGAQFNNWFTNSQEHAFFLNGSREPGEPVDTPAPAGLALLGFGLVALGAARRRKA